MAKGGGITEGGGYYNWVRKIYVIGIRDPTKNGGLIRNAGLRIPNFRNGGTHPAIPITSGKASRRKDGLGGHPASRAGRNQNTGAQNGTTSGNKIPWRRAPAELGNQPIQARATAKRAKVRAPAKARRANGASLMSQIALASAKAMVAKARANLRRVGDIEV